MKQAGKNLLRFLPVLPLALSMSACSNGEDLGSTLSEAAFNMLIGMGTVFIVLVIISFIIWLFKFIGIAEKRSAERKRKQIEAKTPATPVIEVPAGTEETEDSEKLAAVIAAAIAAFEGTDPDGIIVRSIRRVHTRKQKA